MDLIPQEIDHYARLISSPESETLKRLNRDTHAKVLKPRMLSGHLQGRLLEMISMMISPQRVLEVGTYTGYSAICLARGLKENGKLHTIDHNPELKDFAATYIKAAGMDNKIIQHTGEALDVIPTIHEIFDLAFIDADKENYIRYFDMVYDKLRPGGCILADNVLWSGKVIGHDNEIPGEHQTGDSLSRTEKSKRDPETEAIKQFNEYLRTHPGVHNLLLPFRDGLMISIKI